MTLDEEDENPELVELIQLLQNPYLQGILYCHDCIAQKDFVPKLQMDEPCDEDDGGVDEETIKVVQLVKSSEPLVRIFTLSPSISLIYTIIILLY